MKIFLAVDPTQFTLLQDQVRTYLRRDNELTKCEVTESVAVSRPVELNPTPHIALPSLHHNEKKTTDVIAVPIHKDLKQKRKKKVATIKKQKLSHPPRHSHTTQEAKFANLLKLLKARKASKKKSD